MMNYDIAFLSFIIPKEIEKEVRGKSLNRMEEAAIAWQKHIIAGIEKNNHSEVKMINILPIEAFPSGYKDAVIRKTFFKHASNAQDVNVGYCNVKIVKRFIQWWPIFQEVDSWAKQKSDKKKVLIAYTMYPEFMKAISRVKRKWPEIITIDIVVDLPQFIALGEKKLSTFGKIYQRWSRKQAEKNLYSVDGFSVITKQMVDIISKNKPFEVIEGISTEEFPKLQGKRDGTIRVIYAGLLHRRFGIIKLLNAFEKINDTEFSLIICGVGETENEILERAKNNNRIEFLGKLPRQSVLEIMSSCDVIVNPRENKGEYTKYSFPSKNLEALSSGIPFIGYKLDGIPDEYDQYINYPKDDSEDALAECIYNVGKNDNKSAKEKALNAKNWVLSSKSCSEQGKKIFRLIERISSNN